MSGDPVQPESSTLPVRRLDLREDKEQERSRIELRRRAIAEWRFVEALTLEQIQERLKAELKIETTLATISRDVAIARKYVAKEWKDFDPVVAYRRMIARLDALALRAIGKSHAATTAAEEIAYMRTAGELTGKILDAYVDAGIVDRQMVQRLTIRPDDGKKVERVPSGEEMRAWIEAHGVVQDGELISEAERAYRYGDEAAVESAEGDA